MMARGGTVSKYQTQFVIEITYIEMPVTPTTATLSLARSCMIGGSTWAPDQHNMKSSLLQDSTWGGQIELQAAVGVLQVTICIHQAEAPVWTMRDPSQVTPSPYTFASSFSDQSNASNT